MMKSFKLGLVIAGVAAIAVLIMATGKILLAIREDAAEKRAMEQIKWEPPKTAPAYGTCGGFMAGQNPPCPEGYYCKLPPNTADAEGTCMPDEPPTVEAATTTVEYPGSWCGVRGQHTYACPDGYHCAITNPEFKEITTCVSD